MPLFSQLLLQNTKRVSHIIFNSVFYYSINIYFSSFLLIEKLTYTPHSFTVIFGDDVDDVNDIHSIIGDYFCDVYDTNHVYRQIRSHATNFQHKNPRDIPSSQCCLWKVVANKNTVRFLIGRYPFTPDEVVLYSAIIVFDYDLSKVNNDMRSYYPSSCDWNLEYSAVKGVKCDTIAIKMFEESIINFEHSYATTECNCQLEHE